MIIWLNCSFTSADSHDNKRWNMTRGLYATLVTVVMLQQYISVLFTDCGKKLEKLGSKHQSIGKWKQVIIKHLYYTASKGEGIPEKNVAIWNSLRNHLVNRHEHPESPLYNRCEHEAEEGRVWLKESEQSTLELFAFYIIKVYTNRYIICCLSIWFKNQSWIFPILRSVLRNGDT